MVAFRPQKAQVFPYRVVGAAAARAEARLCQSGGPQLRLRAKKGSYFAVFVFFNLFKICRLGHCSATVSFSIFCFGLSLSLSLGLESHALPFVI